MSLVDALLGHYWTVRPLLRRGPEDASVDLEAVECTHGALQLAGLVAAQSPDAPWIIGLHGLGASPKSAYMMRAASRCAARGFNWAAFSPPWCASRGFLHRYPDARGLIDAFFEHAAARWGCDAPALGVIGFSLGGVAALRAVSGDSPGTFGADVRGVCAICPPLHERAAYARIDAPHMIAYRRSMIAWLRDMDTQRIPPARDALRTRTLHRAQTMQAWGALSGDVHDSDDMSWGCVIDVPSMILATREDPLVPARSLATFTDALDPRVTLRWTRGGHLGFARGLDAELSDVLSWMEARF